MSEGSKDRTWEVVKFAVPLTISLITFAMGYGKVTNRVSELEKDVATLQAAFPSGAGYTPTISINFGGSQYTTGGAGETARTSLISTFGWTISDGGGV